MLLNMGALVATILVTLPMNKASAQTERIETQAQAPAEQNIVEKPFKLSLDYRSDVVSGLRGGNNARPVFLGALGIAADLGLDKLIGAKGLTSHIEGTVVYGQAPAERIGDLQGTDNISTPHSIKLYQVWLQQNYFEDRLSLLVGLHDLTNEFYTDEAASVFLNTSFAVSPELARSGRAGPSMWPTTALGARARVQLSDTFQTSAAVYDGVPGDPDHPAQNAIILNEDTGVMGIAEISALPKINGMLGKYSIGTWAYNRSLDDLSELDENSVPLKAKSFGVYMLAEQRLYAPVQGEARGLAGFLRLGWASASTDPIEYSAQSGVVYTGLIRGRELDQLGLGAAVARAGSHYRSAAVLKGAEMSWAETSIELTYRLKLAPWLMLQPDAQWIANPSMNPSVADAFVATGRMEVTF